MLQPLRLGLAGAILWSGSILLMSLIWIVFPTYCVLIRELLMGAYPGYSISLFGVVIGVFWGFLDAFIGLWILAWLYNKLSDWV